MSAKNPGTPLIPPTSPEAGSAAAEQEVTTPTTIARTISLYSSGSDSEGEEVHGFDMSGDGVIDSLDTNRDGRIDSLLHRAPSTKKLLSTKSLTAVPIDLGSSQGTIMGFDTTGDGKLDAFDTTGDGVIDTTITKGRHVQLSSQSDSVRGFDTSGDGVIDSFDMNGDGRIDTLLVPVTPETRPRRKSEPVSIPLGVTEESVAQGFDTTGDGQVDALDTTGDGKVDHRVLRGREVQLRAEEQADKPGDLVAPMGWDTSGDGMIDSLDTLGDGRIDQLLRKAPATEQRPTTDLKAVPIKLGENAAPVMGYDTTGDGKVDALDTNGDGVIDTTIVPGRQLKLGEHTNVRGFDTSGDGVVDAFDSNGDGRIDTLIVPLPKSVPETRLRRKSEPVAVPLSLRRENSARGFDTNGDGQVDALDTTGDGQVDHRVLRGREVLLSPGDASLGTVMGWDMSGDGVIDSLDMVGDGRIDTVLLKRSKLLPAEQYKESAIAIDLQSPYPTAKKERRGSGTIVGYDTTGDGRIDAFDTTGDGMIDTMLASIDKSSIMSPTMLHDMMQYDHECRCNQPCCGNKYCHLVFKRLFFTREMHYVMIAFLFVMTVLTTTVVIWRLCHMTDDSDPEWFIAMDFTVDVIVVTEVIVGLAYLGKDYWKSNLNRVDFVIGCVCLVNAICYFAPIDEHDDEDVGKSIRVLRDITRFLRLLFFLRWFTTSTVKMDIKFDEDGSMLSDGGGSDEDTEW